MNIYRAFPEPRVMLALDDDTARATLRQWYQPFTEQSVRASIISTPQGVLAGPDGTSRSLSNPADRAILVAQRQSSDAIITGKTTVVTEPVPIPRHAPLVIVSTTGDLRGHQITPESFRDHGVLVLTGDSFSEDPLRSFPEGVASHIALDGGGVLGASSIIDFLRSRGLNHLLVEGGKTLLEHFASAGAIDEVCLSLTQAPLSENHPPLPWWDSQWGDWTALHVLTDDTKTLYFRYRKVV